MGCLIELLDRFFRVANEHSFTNRRGKLREPDLRNLSTPPTMRRSYNALPFHTIQGVNTD